MVSSGRLNWILYSFFLVSGSYFYVTSDFRLLSPVLWVLSVIALVPLYVKSGLKASIDKKGLYYLLLFFVLGAVSALGTDSLELGVGAFFIVFLFFLTGLALNGTYYVGDSINGFIIGFFTVSFLFLLVSFFLSVPSIGKSYSGLTYNPNSFGGILATIIYVCCALSLGCFLSGDGGRGFFYLLVSAAIFGVVLLTRSRASVGASFVAYVLFFSFYLIAFFKRSRGFRVDRYLAINFCLFLIVIFSSIIIFSDVFYYGFVEKMQRKAEAGDVTDGRLEVWLYVLSNLSAFGNGRSAFEGLEHGAHSTYISLLAQYGWAHASIFFGFCLWNLVRFAKLSFSSCPVGGKYVFLPIFSLTCFLLLSLFEGMMMKSSMFVFLFFGCISSGKYIFNVSGRR